MPSHRARRRGGRFVGGILAISTAAALSLVGSAAPSHASDDYPYAGVGHCPLVPLPPHATKPGKPGKPHKPGKPDKPGKPHSTPTADPSSSPPAPPRECAKHIWFYNGSYGDPWGFALRNCTSFVAWRLRTTNGFADFSNNVDGGAFGNADQWDDNALALGYLVDDVPAVGAVAQTDDGRVGHVAWVSAVGNGTVTVEEYNYYVPGGYDVRTAPTSDFRYLHLADVSPDPSLGSTRAAATTAAAGGGLWTARTTPQGDLTVRPASGHAVHLGSRGLWSTAAAPSLAPDTLGRTWVAAVSATGQVLTAHTTLGASQLWSHPRAIKGGPWSTTSTPTLALDGQGRIRLLSVSAAGDLVERHTVSARVDRWSRGNRIGRAGSWATHVAPAAATDARGRLWAAAVTRGGALEVQHTQGRGWSHFRAVDRRTWSTTSSPALTLANDGRLWLTSVSARGQLFSRHTEAGSSHWQHPQQAAGLWSPYSSPMTTVDTSGRLWLAAVQTDGSLAVHSADAGSTRWHDEGVGPGSQVTASPSFLASGSSGVRVGTVTATGQAVWARTGAAQVVAPVSTGPRGGGFILSLLLHL